MKHFLSPILLLTLIPLLTACSGGNVEPIKTIEDIPATEEVEGLSLKEFNDLEEEVEELSMEVESSSMEVGELKMEVGEVMMKVGEVSMGIRELPIEFGELSIEVEDLKKEVGGLLTEVGELSIEVGESSMEVEELLAEVGELLTEVGELLMDVEELSTEVGELLMDVEELSTEVEEPSMEELIVEEVEEIAVEEKYIDSLEEIGGELSIRTQVVDYTTGEAIANSYVYVSMFNGSMCDNGSGCDSFTEVQRAVTNDEGVFYLNFDNPEDLPFSLTNTYGIFETDDRFCLPDFIFTPDHEGILFETVMGAYVGGESVYEEIDPANDEIVVECKKL